MSRKELYHVEEPSQTFFCCCFEWAYPEEFLHSFKTKKKMSSCSREKTDCALPHILNIFSLACARLLDSTIVAKIKQAKRK